MLHFPFHSILSQQQAPGLLLGCVHLHTESLFPPYCQFTAHFNSASLFLTPPTDIDKCIVTIATPQYNLIDIGENSAFAHFLQL